MNCPICSSGTGQVCHDCISKWGTTTIDGKPLEYGIFPSTDIIFTRIKGTTDYVQDDICYVKGVPCLIVKDTCLKLYHYHTIRNEGTYRRFLSG
jgi:hypothetical protein